MGSFKDHVSNVKIIFFDGVAVFSLEQLHTFGFHCVFITIVHLFNMF